MMYNNMLAVCVKVNGKVLRENGNIVKLPFGSEYSLFFKNMNNKRVAVSIEIDGENIGDNHKRLIIDANSYTELKRYLTKDNAFKFIEKTEEISNYRGNRPEDGLIRIEYEYEFPFAVNTNYLSTNLDNYSTSRFPADCTWTTMDSNIYLRSNCDNGIAQMSCNTNGITVAGDKTNQSFRTTNFNGFGLTDVMIIQLIGYTEESNKYIETPLYVSDKITCPTCGRKNKSKNKFCYNCGTCLR